MTLEGMHAFNRERLLPNRFVGYKFELQQNGQRTGDWGQYALCWLHGWFSYCLAWVHKMRFWLPRTISWAWSRGSWEDVMGKLDLRRRMDHQSSWNTAEWKLPPKVICMKCLTTPFPKSQWEFCVGDDYPVKGENMPCWPAVTQAVDVALGTIIHANPKWNGFFDDPLRVGVPRMGLEEAIDFHCQWLGGSKTLKWPMRHGTCE